MAPRQPDRSPYVPSARPRDDKHQGPSSLFYDSGIAHGLQRAPSHRIRSFRRPIVYSNPLADFNNWDAMFMERLMGGITIHKPVVPPTVILTLGNGFDFWAIHAAQRWHKCRVTAHSLLGMHKDGMDNLIRTLRLSDRVTYVRGDPSKELHLDYPNNTFDMVRLSYCSLNLAETEWYVFLQEVNRVLKAGGVLEVIDEDLLFPGHKPPPLDVMPSAQHCRPPSKPVPLPDARTDSQFLRAPDTRSINAPNHPPPSPLSSVHSHNQDDWNRSEADLSSLQYAIDPVDHSKLTRAWHEMLTSRWISPSITSVLPFYLSAIFEDFRALPALEILIGPSSPLCPCHVSSGTSQQMIDPEPFRHLAHATVKEDAESSTTWMPAKEAPPHLMPAHAPMHLARMVAIVMSCKDAIWDTYNKLYGNDFKQPRDGPGKPSIHLVREDFESHWLNWECDMRSRIDMVSNARERLQWPVRLPSRPESDSDSGRWLKSVRHVQSQKDLIGLASPHPVKPDVVRCVRGFVAWKFTGV